MKQWGSDKEKLIGKSADELNPFRKAYFNKFETENRS